MNDPSASAPHHPELLRKYRLAPPTRELRERVLEAARQAWATGDVPTVPWTASILRLAASLVFAVLSIVTVPVAGRLLTVRWQCPGPYQTRAGAEIHALAESLGQPGLTRLAMAVSSRPNAQNPLHLLNHARQISEMLRPVAPNGSG